MRKLYLAILGIVILFFTSCGDGDEFSVTLDFDGELEMCTLSVNDINNFVIFDVRQAPFESLTLVIPDNETNQRILFNPNNGEEQGSFPIGTSAQFNLRSYNGDPLEVICQPIPSSTVSITQDSQATTGTVNFTSTARENGNTRTIEITFSITNLDIEILRATEVQLGTLTIDVEI